MNPRRKQRDVRRAPSEAYLPARGVPSAEIKKLFSKNSPIFFFIGFKNNLRIEEQRFIKVLPNHNEGLSNTINEDFPRIDVDQLMSIKDQNRVLKVEYYDIFGKKIETTASVVKDEKASIKYNERTILKTEGRSINF